MEGDVLFAGGERKPVFDFHAQGHELITEGFAVAKPRGHFAGEGAGLKALPREGGEMGKFTLLERRIDAAREGVEHNREAGEKQGDNEGVEFTEFHVEGRSELEASVDKRVVGCAHKQGDGEGEQQDGDGDAKRDLQHLPGETLREGDALNEHREVAPNGGAEREGGDPEPEVVEEGTGGDKVVEMGAPAEADGEKGEETREIVEIENTPADENEQETVEMEQWGGDEMNDAQEGVFLQEHNEAEVDAPKHEVPTCAVPQPRQKPDTKDVEGLMAAIPAHGNVDVVAKEATE